MLSMLVAAGVGSAPLVQITPLKTYQGSHVIALAAASTGSRFAATMEDGSVRIIDASTRITGQTLIGHPQPPYAVVWSADSKLIASGDESARVFVWDVHSGQRIKTFRSHIRGIQRLSFDPKHTRLMSTGKDDVLKIYNLKTGKDEHTILGKGANFYGAMFDRKGSRILTGILGDGARLYDLSGNLVGLLKGHQGMGVNDVDLNSSGSRALTVGRDGNAIVWDMGSRAPLGALQGHKDWVQSGRFSPNGRMAATSSVDRTVRIWDTVKMTSVGILENESAIGSPLCWTGDGRYLI
ncbi:MAG: WD40 repeat domain-containing protein, partial [Fimbriimonas ginsengisoli]|nr:WD40 repeat domain-containing protein [Fimbriimonas ginsengisoli]